MLKAKYVTILGFRLVTQELERFRFDGYASVRLERKEEFDANSERQGR